MIRMTVAAVALTIGATTARAQDMGIEIGKQAPAAAMTTLDGKAADLSALVGKGPVLLEFWATWCPNCKELEPSILALNTKYGSKVRFIGVAVSVNQSPALVKRYVTNHKLPGTQFYDTKGNATEAYDVPATSYVVLVDKSGKIVYTGLGGSQGPAIEKAIKALGF